jgi:ATP-dependent helicase HrpA
LRARLDGLTLRDADRLGRRLRSFRAPVTEAKFDELSRQVAAAESLVATRAAAVPAIT